MPVNPADNDTIRVETLMRELGGQVREDLRRQLLANGGSREYEDPRIFESVERILRVASERGEHEVRLLPEVLSDDPEWRLDLHLRFSSHRPLIGPVIVFLKRRILLPLMRWLYEYSAHNFQRQQRLNVVLISCIEELAIENARLRHDLVRFGGQR
jgi:hypothetical protein